MIVDQKPAVRKRAFYEHDLKKMAEDKDLSKRHWRHKPYQCDFGDGKNGKKDEV